MDLYVCNFHDWSRLHILLQAVLLKNETIGAFPRGSFVHDHLTIVFHMTRNKFQRVGALLKCCDWNLVIAHFGVPTMLKLDVVEPIFDDYSVVGSQELHPFSVEFILANSKTNRQLERLPFQNLNARWIAEVCSIQTWLKVKIPLSSCATFSFDLEVSNIDKLTEIYNALFVSKFFGWVMSVRLSVNTMSHC